MRERVRVASVSVVWIGGLEFSKCDGLEDSFGLRCSIFAIKTNKSPNLAPISPRRHQPSAQPVQDLIYALVGFRAALGDEDEDFGAAAAGAGVSSRDSSSLSLPNNPAPSTGFLVEELRFGLARAASRWKALDELFNLNPNVQGTQDFSGDLKARTAWYLKSCPMPNGMGIGQ